MPFLADVAVASFPPAHGKAYHSFGMVVGWRHAVLFQKEPKGVHLPQQSGGEPRGVVLFTVIASDQFDESGVEHVPLPPVRRLMGHMHKPSQLGQGVFAEGGGRWVFAFRQLFGVANQMRQAGLSQADPFGVKPVAVADQDAFPILDQLPEGFLGPLAVNHEEGDRSAGQDPKPAQDPFEVPGGLVDVVHFLFARLLADRFVMGKDCLRGAVDHLLDRAQRDGEIENRGANVLDHGAAVALSSRQFGDEGAHPRAVAGTKLLGDGRVVDLSAATAFALVQRKVGYLDGHLR